MPVDVVFDFKVDVPGRLDEFREPVRGFQAQRFFGITLGSVSFGGIETNKPVAVTAMVNRIAVNDGRVSGGHPQRRFPMPDQICEQRCTE